MLPSDLNYWLSFSAFIKIGPQTFKRLLAYFGTAEKAFFAPSVALAQAGLTAPMIEQFLAWRQTFHLEPLLKIMERENITPCPLGSPSYPALLRHISNPPFLLYVKGDISYLKEGSFPIALVGTRGASAYGRQVAFEMSQELVKQGIMVISGGALGIDTEAHKGTLKAHGHTVAVLAGGVDEASWFPKDNARLFKTMITQSSALVSEMPPGFHALHFSFPYRNRIIAGISRGTVVIEAPEESGALITARYALEYNREVFAVPGSVYNPQAKGVNGLIRQGAQLVTSVPDILEAFNLKPIPPHATQSALPPLSAPEEKIISLLSREPMHVDAIVQRAGIPASEVNAALTMLELKGVAKNMGGMSYVRMG